MLNEDHGSGWCCRDCLFLIAYGDTPDDWGPNVTAEWLADIERMSEGQSSPATIGHFHTDMAGCWHPDEECSEDECDCEEVPFGTRPCEHCGSSLAGSRHAFTWWVPATTTSDV